MNMPDILITWICLFSIHTTGGYSLQCFHCNNAVDVTHCNSKTQCGPQENCFIERYGNLPYSSFKLGCLEHEHCPSVPTQSFTLVGRDLHQNEVPECRMCCTTDNCNTQLCDFQLSAPSSRTPVPCIDRDNDCAHLNSTADVCANVQNAKKFCRKFCNLCNLVDGAWNVWSDWSKCGVSCGRGTMSRMRDCNNPAPAHGGLACTGNGSETKFCHPLDCPVHGGWAAWQNWDSCSARCGLGLAKRHRTCTNPTPTLFGHVCFGDNVETRLCNGTDCIQTTSSPPTTSEACVDALNECKVLNSSLAICADQEKARTVCKHFCGLCGVVDGQWTYWSDWKPCSVTCGNGTTSRSRSCTNPSPVNGGHTCTGQVLETKMCNERECPVDGGWGTWITSICSVTCGTGTVSKLRECNNPKPSNGGSQCVGNALGTVPCSLGNCPVNGIWSAWASWDTCSATCGKGFRTRRRDCNNPTPAFGGEICLGDTLAIGSCQVTSCPTISFLVNNPSQTRYTKGMALVFKTIISNDGGGYSLSSGKFTAPLAGQYLFSLTEQAHPGGADVRLMQNNRDIGRAQPHDSQTYDTASFTAVLDLIQGDNVWAKYIDGSFYQGIDTSFTGVLIHT